MNPISRREEMREECGKFHARNPEVWRLFERFALEKIRLGFAHYGAKAVLERVRWEYAEGGHEPELKVNNNFPAFYARRFAREYPQYAGFFRTRAQVSECRPATGLPEPTRWSV